MIDTKQVYALCDDIQNRHADGSEFDRGMRTAAKHIARAIAALRTPAAPEAGSNIHGIGPDVDGGPNPHYRGDDAEAGSDSTDAARAALRSAFKMLDRTLLRDTFGPEWVEQAEAAISEARGS